MGETDTGDASLLYHPILCETKTKSLQHSTRGWKDPAAGPAQARPDVTSHGDPST